MSWFHRKPDETPDTPTEAPTAPAVPETPPSPVAPYEVGQIVLIEGRYHTLEPARIVDKIAGNWESVFVVDTVLGRKQVGPYNIFTVTALQVAIDAAQAFGGTPTISLDDPDK
jgi:hypothetical protein